MGLIYLLYYQFKPVVPKALQICLRRKWVSRKLGKCRSVWPIDERAGAPPKGFTGWPEGKRFALIITHDVETPLGVERCVEVAKLEKELGFRSSFNFVAEDYPVPSKLFDYLRGEGFEIGLHGLSHDGNMFRSKRHFMKKAPRINRYIKEWKCAGFRAPSMYHDLPLTGHLDVQYDCSTFDTDPFEPQPDGVGTIFPFWVPSNGARGGYVELPYTLPQDHTLFVLIGEKDISMWKKKLDWIVKQGGMALLITHPDYMNFEGCLSLGEYPAAHYRELLDYVRERYCGFYWNPVAENLVSFWEKSQKKIEDILGKAWVLTQ